MLVATYSIRPNVLWALDFQSDTTVDGRSIKLLNVIDELTRECLQIRADRSINADAVVAVLDRLAMQRGGAPVYVRFDKGRDFVAHAVDTGADSTARTPCSSTRIAVAERVDRALQWSPKQRAPQCLSRTNSFCTWAVSGLAHWWPSAVVGGADQLPARLVQ